MERPIKRRRRLGTALLLAALCAGLALGGSGCGRSGHTDMNMPYEPDTPAPPPHEGTFVSDHGTMTFSGDGQHVTLCFDGDLAERLGLPAGEQPATYAFCSGDLPPHGHVETRYDAAMALRLTVGEGDGAVQVLVDAGKYEDGHFYTGTNCITAERITLFVGRTPGGSDWEPVDFLKQ